MAPYCWRWREIGPYLDRIGEIARAADVSPIEFADRQQFLLVNPGLGGRLQVAAPIRCAEHLSGEGITNQGRVRSDNIAARVHDGLLFRSRPEVLFYEALKRKGV